MNSNNMEPFSNNLALMESFNLSNQGFYDHHHHQPQAFNNGITPRSVGPNDPIFNPTAHIFPSGHGWNNNTNTMQEHETPVNASPSVSGAGLFGVHGNKAGKKHQVQNYGGKKRRKMSEREMEKPKEVVHVRAKRGQATDSHSLAERLRREKINDKLRCLQDLVPGCYKTMGMAVMLDVIINYVRSLQNQIDFLSMKLSAASFFYDFNSSEAEAMELVQVGGNGYEAAQMMEKLLVGEGYNNNNNGGLNSHFQTPNNWPL